MPAMEWEFARSFMLTASPVGCPARSWGAERGKSMEGSLHDAVVEGKDALARRGERQVDQIDGVPAQQLDQGLQRRGRLGGLGHLPRRVHDHRVLAEATAREEFGLLDG